MSRSDLHSAWARLFLASLAGAGLRHVVLSPGSRSTPLAVAAAHESRLSLHILVDERVAAFFALGQARVSGEPSLLICTSGSAGGHYLPAIIEASQSHLPLIVVTADRPWDAYDCASSQTIDQVKLFGDCVRHYAELGLPDPQPSALAAVARIAAQAVARSRGPQPGPVHINARFRKPLEPVLVGEREPFSDTVDALLAKGPPRVFAPLLSAGLDAAALLSLALLCAERPRGIVVCGPAWAGTDAPRLRAALAKLTAVTGYAVWAEATSGLRFGLGAIAHGAFDAFLRAPALRGGLAPTLIIELGGPPVSSSYAGFLAQHPDCVRAVVAPQGWNDPSGCADLMIPADPATLCEALAQHPLLATPPPSQDRGALRTRLDRVEAQTWAVVDEVQRDGLLSEGAAISAVVAALPADSTLMVGNSLAVRDLDLFCPPTDKPLRVLHQRGAAGIDGLIAGAAGTRSRSAAPLSLLLGDISAQHDLGGLAALQQVPGPLLVVVLNNGGGRIFEQLPVASSPSVQGDFERLFVTPQQIDFAAAAQAFAVPHARVRDRDELSQALATGLRSDRPMLIECCVPATDGTQRRAEVWSRVATALSASMDLPVASARSSMPSRPVVFLHGFLGGPAQWQGIRGSLNRPTQAAYLPGHGPSPRRVGDDFDAVVAHLASELPAAGCELVGYSLGARLALALALHAPDRVQALTLIGVDPGFVDEEATDRARRQAWEDELATQLETDGLPAFVDRWQQLPIFASQLALPPDKQAEQRRQRLSHQAAGLAWSLRTLGTGRMPGLWSRLAALRAPVRLISGALDDKFVRIGQRLQRCVPGLSHIILPNIGHNAVLEAPELIEHILRTPHGYIEHQKAQDPRNR